MLDSIIKWSLNNRWLVLLASFLLIVFGIQSVQNTELDVFPEFAPPQVIIQTELPGMTPEEIENLVTIPLENSLNGTPKLKTIRSFSTPGLSAVTAIFDWGTDQYLARQLISERLQTALSRLPIEAKPYLNPISSPVGNVLTFAFTSSRTSPMELRTLIDWPVKNRLLSVPGVTNLSIYGGEAKQYQVLVNPAKLAQFDLTLQELEAALRNSNVSMPGGFFVRDEREILVKTQGRILSIESLANSVIKSIGGTPITLKQVADVQLGPAFKRGDGSFNGKPAIILQIHKRPNADTLKVSREAEQALKEIKTSFPKDVKIHQLYAQSDYILDSVENVLSAIRDGAILVVLVLFIFLWNWRTSIISLLAIPLSVLTALCVLKYFGQSINVMTLGGLAIALGEVVDDAVIDVENVYRRLRENAQKEEQDRASVLEVIFRASKEIRGSVIFATLIVILAFIPIFALGSIEGELFKPLGYAYIISIGASLFVALTVTPVMCLVLLGRQSNLPHEEPPFSQKLKLQFQKLFDWGIKNTRKLVLVIGIAFALALGIILFIGKGFLPELGERNLVVMTYLKPGTNLQKNFEVGLELEKALLKIPGVKSVGQRIGRAAGELDPDPLDSNIAHLDIQIDKKLNDSEVKKVVHQIQELLNSIPGIGNSGGSFLSHAIEDVLSGIKAQVAIKVFGTDFDVLQEKAAEIEEIVKNTKGAIDVQTEPITKISQIQVQLNSAEASRYGLTS
ncbi:MAG: efflux RND transporter permease subunit, partial [Candidatus Caenarcaniphilales bacterium]|nr:efflux RND transporter permease subunit [Candidatus Caenarcaniphilales bacterium]